MCHAQKNKVPRLHAVLKKQTCQSLKAAHLVQRLGYSQPLGDDDCSIGGRSTSKNFRRHDAADALEKVHGLDQVRSVRQLKWPTKPFASETSIMIQGYNTNTLALHIAAHR